MADNDISFRQLAVIEFLVKEEIPAAEIHQRLQRAYGSVCVGASSVRRWVKHFKDGNKSTQDQPRSGRLEQSQLNATRREWIYVLTHNRLWSDLEETALRSIPI